MPGLYYIGRIIIRMLLLLLTRLRVKGRENIPNQGPLLIVANHMNLTDPVLLGVTLNRKLVFMAKEELFRSRFSRYLMSSLSAFPVHRGQLDRKALRLAHQLLEQGQALVTFPEGKRSKTAQLQPAFSGSTLIALRSGAPILPVGITGTEKLRGVAWLWHRPRLTVNIGHPFHLPPVNGKFSKTELTKLTTLLMMHVAELLPLEYRGNYGGKNSLKD